MKKCFYLILPILFLFLIFTSVHSSPSKGYKSIAIDTSTDRIFAVKEDEKDIDVIDIKTGDITNTIFLNKEIETIAIDEQRRILAVAEEEKIIHIISLDTFETLSSIKTREEAKSIGIDSELGILLNTDEEDRLTATDLNTYQKIKEIKISEKPVSIAIDSQLHIAVIVHNTWGKNNKKGEKDRDNITIIDLNTLAIIKALDAGKNPIAVAINPLAHEAAIANEKSNVITIIDLNALSVKGTTPAGKHPEALSYNECLNTLSAIGGEGKAWAQVMDMDTWVKKASYTFKDELKDIKIHSYSNKAAITGEYGLNIISLPNPVPQLTSITPDKALRGEKSTALTITGKGLLAITEIYLNGNKTNSTFLGCGSIEVDIPEEYLKNTGDIEIKAINPEPEGGISNPLYLKVENPVPTISAIDPLEVKAGIPSLTLNVYGTGFFPDTEIYFNNLKKAITYISPTKLLLNLISEDLKTAGEYEITARNLSPGGGNSNKVIFTIKPSLEITITSPQDGETINKAKTIVKGTFKSDTKDVGITINGIIAEITGNEWIANNIPLAIGTNTTTANIKDSKGNTESATITINTTDTTQHVTLSANITSGIAPLQVYFSVSTSFIPASYQMDFEGDGIVDYTGTTFENVTRTYTAEGIFYPTIIITDNQGKTYSETIAITVLNKTEIDALLKSKWEGMKGALANKDVRKAVSYFTDWTKERYSGIFSALGDRLPQVAQDMQNITMIYLRGNVAKYRIRRMEAAGEITYYIYFVKDENGLWKIQQF